MSKRVSIELREGEFIVSSYDQDPAGFWEMNGHFTRVRADPSVGPARQLGSATMEALEASNAGQPGSQTGDPLAVLLKALNLRSYAQYMKGAASVNVRLNDDGVLRVTPTRNGGPRNGFEHLPDEARTLEPGDPLSLGSALIEAFKVAAANTGK